MGLLARCGFTVASSAVALCLVLLRPAHAQTISGTADQINCKTASCAQYDVWEPAPFDNSTEMCERAQDQVLYEFAAVAPDTCREWTAAGMKGWKDCRKMYCQTFANVASNLSHHGTNLYYGGENDECRPLLNFNQTLCETSYRDAEGFCDCLCPTMTLLNAQSGGCDAAIVAFLLLGRRGVKLFEKHGLNGYCARFLCDYLALIGEPNPPYPIPGIPGTCQRLDLPWRVYNCVELTKRKPYTPEPWKKPVQQDNVLECTDGTQHEVDIRHIDTWGACESHRGRWRCPKNFPIMCQDPYACSGDHCCVQLEEECERGVKKASVLLDLELQEWLGKPTPDMLYKWATTTTMDAYAVFLQNVPTTTFAPSTAEQIKDYVWIGTAVFGVVGLFAFFFGCMYMGRINVKKINKVILGPGRLFSIYKSDPVSVFLPSGNLPRNKQREAPLPPARPQQEIEAERLDALACQKLEETWNLAVLKGTRHLVHKAGQPEPPQASPMRSAVANVRARGLQDRGNNDEIIRNCEKWLDTLQVETMLLEATEDARPDLRWTAQTRLTAAPVVGKPWVATTMCKMAEGEVRKSGWTHIEFLRDAIQVASKKDISPVLMNQANALLTELVAKTPELPADRCVLDPEGEGIKLLPKGQTRAVWPITGDTYTYDQQTSQAGNMGDESLPREVLGDVAIDDARPVCAEWAKSARCKAGRNCPWRHCRPKAGDSIRECILFDV